MKTFAHMVHEALTAVAPITGVSIGRKDDKSTWRINFAEEATAAQKEAAAALIAEFDLEACARWEELELQIVALEAQQTPRRIREATLGQDGGWLAGINQQIQALREKTGG